MAFKRKSARTIGACLLAWAAFAPGSFYSPQASYAADLNAPAYDLTAETRRVVIGLNKSMIVELPRHAREVLVSSPEYVDAVVRSTRTSYLIGKKVGQTNIFYFDASGQRILTLEVQVERDLADLQNLFDRMIPGSSIRPEAMNDNIILTGRVVNMTDASRAQDIAARFIGDKDGKKILNMLVSESRDQVQLKVTIAEMQRSVIKQLGIDISALGSIGSKIVSFQTAFPFSIAGQALSGTVASATRTKSNGNSVGGVLRALERNGLLRTLAEPNLTAVSGETAKFLAGGEFPIPVGRDDNGITIEFKEFGVGLTFTPTVLDAGRISLKIATEVSELSNAGAFTLGSVTSATLTVPGLKVRRANTTVELSSGGSLVMAGLIQENTKQSLNGLPGAQDIPILGALFRSRDYQNEETELVVIVTPYIVRQVSRDKLARPDEGYVPPNDGEAVLLGRLNAIYGMKNPQERIGRYRGSYGFIME